LRTNTHISWDRRAAAIEALISIIIFCWYFYLFVFTFISANILSILVMIAYKYALNFIYNVLIYIDLTFLTCLAHAHFIRHCVHIIHSLLWYLPTNLATYNLVVKGTRGCYTCMHKWRTYVLFVFQKTSSNKTRNNRRVEHAHLSNISACNLITLTCMKCSDLKQNSGTKYPKIRS